MAFVVIQIQIHINSASIVNAEFSAAQINQGFGDTCEFVVVEISMLHPVLAQLGSSENEKCEDGNR